MFIGGTNAGNSEDPGHFAQIILIPHDGTIFKLLNFGIPLLTLWIQLYCTKVIAFCRYLHSFIDGVRVLWLLSRIFMIVENHYFCAWNIVVEHVDWHDRIGVCGKTLAKDDHQLAHNEFTLVSSMVGNHPSDDMIIRSYNQIYITFLQRRGRNVQKIANHVSIKWGFFCFGNRDNVDKRSIDGTGSPAEIQFCLLWCFSWNYNIVFFILFRLEYNSSLLSFIASKKAPWSEYLSYIAILKTEASK